MFGVHVSRSSLLLCFHCICEVVVCMTKLKFQYFETGVSWNTGYRLCQDKGGQLLKIRSKEIQNVLKKYRPSGGWPNDFWVGVNKNSNNDIIFDDCEPASSWSNWDSSPANDKPCVMLKKDDLTWVNEVCSKEVNVMCGIPTGSCTYQPTIISCPTSGNRIISSTSSSACQTHCEQTKDSNDFNCWAYKWDGSQCTVYYSEDPYFCDAGSSASVDTYIRVCYEYDFQSLSYVTRSGESGDNPSSRTCSSWDPPTTTTSTTEAITTTEKQTTESHTTTAESTTSETSTNVQTTPESQTTTGAQTTGAQPTETQTTSNQTTSEIHHSTDAQTTPTVRITSETTTNIETTQTTTSAQTTPEAESTTGILTEQTATDPITITESSFERLDYDVCVCDFCGDRNKTTVENEIKEIMSKLKVDVQVLSATRRKKESQPDNRPSAKNIGYLGIFLFVSVFGTIFILDIKKLSSDLGLIKQ